MTQELPLDFYATSVGVTKTWDKVKALAAEYPQLCWIRVRWTGNDCVLAENNLDQVPLSVIDKRASVALGLVAVASPILTALHRFEAADIEGMGVVVKEMPAGTRVNTMSNSLLSRRTPEVAPLIPLFNEVPAYRALTTSGEQPCLGWFAPDADPDAFGTAYLHPHIHKGEHQWQLSYVGMGRELSPEPVSWNDHAGLRSLVSEVLSSDPAYIETVALLSDADDLVAQRRKHRQKIALKEARVTYARPKNRIKPRLVEEQIRYTQNASARLCHDQGFRLGWGSADFVMSTQVRDLRTNERGSKPMNAAAVVTLACGNTIAAPERKDFFSELVDFTASHLAAQINARGLGRVFRLDSKAGENLSSRLFVVANGESFLKHKDVFCGLDSLDPIEVSPS